MCELSIIIVNWNSWKYASRCLESIRATVKNLSYEVIFIDNFSLEDRTREFEKKFNDPSAQFIRNSENAGFAKACNQGMRLAKGDFYLLLNPDAEVHEGAIEKSVDYLKQNTKAGIVGPRLLNSDNSLQRWTGGSFPSVLSAFNHYFFISLFSESCRSMFLGKEPKSPKSVDWVCGAFLLARGSAVREVGFLDESYFMYAEDMDWCMRIKKKGWEVIYSPEAQVLHHSGKSMEKVRKERYWRGLYSIRSFYKQNGANFAELFLFNLITASGYSLRTILFFLKGLVTLQKETFDKAGQSFGFTKAALAILFGQNHFYQAKA